MRAWQIDFLRPSRPWPTLGWLLLAAGLMAITAAGGRFLEEQQAMEARSEQAAKAERARQTEANRRPSGQDRNPPYTDDPRWVQAAGELARPWLSSLQAVETATRAPVYLLSVHSDIPAGRFQLQAETARFEDVLAYLPQLADGAALAQPTLLSHEETQDGTGRRFIRFVVEASWSTP